MKIVFFLFVCFVFSQESVALHTSIVSEKCKLNHITAISKIKEVGILIHPVGGCPTRGNKDCPSLEQIRCRSMEGIIALKKSASKCSIVITGKEIEKLKKRRNRNWAQSRTKKPLGRF
jgi:hypothetical protein